MFGKKKQNEVIDAGAELDQLEGVGGSTLGQQRRASAPGSKMFLLAITAIIVMVGGAFTWKALSITSGDDEPVVEPEKVTRIIPAIEPRPIRAEPAPDPVAVTTVTSQEPQVIYRDRDPEPGPQVRYGAEDEKSKADMIRERMLSSSLGASSTATAAPAGGSGGSGNGGLGSGSGNDLSDKLEPMKLAGARAGMLMNRDFLMSEGTSLDCILQTRMITTQPGMTRCILTRDVYSENGRVVLLDRGTVMTGFYDSGITQGQARIFVQWSRARTPKGVTVELASPGTGPLGEAGVGGYIDTHFWQRFGGAIMISMIGDLGDWASRQGSSQGDNSIQFSNTSQGAEAAATEALRNSINIPPTLYKNQGERVSIFVSRDLDFSHVYSLRAK